MNSTHKEIRQKGPGTVGLERHTQRHWVTREKLGKVELAAAEGQATERQTSTSSELESSSNRNSYGNSGLLPQSRTHKQAQLP